MGEKEVLGMWICQNESAAFWMQILTALKSRGLQDILVTATDNLKGFTEAITSVFPALTQICIVHQLRNSLKFVVWKDKKVVVSALQAIYNVLIGILPIATWRHLTKPGAKISLYR